MFKNAEFRIQAYQDFYPRALEMRAKFDEFFANPGQHTKRHFCWNPWYVPDHYHYMRSYPSDIIGTELNDDFNQHMRSFAKSKLGLSDISGTFLSMYQNGMFQTTHSDMMNGSYGFVFSLTNWDRRKFSGGETLVARENIFDRLEPRDHRGQSTYWEVFPAYFGQLLIFDDRLAHLVPVISGPADPLESRICIHGHIY